VQSVAVHGARRRGPQLGADQRGVLLLARAAGVQALAVDRAGLLAAAAQQLQPALLCSLRPLLLIGLSHATDVGGSRPKAGDAVLRAEQAPRCGARLCSISRGNPVHCLVGVYPIPRSGVARSPLRPTSGDRTFRTGIGLYATLGYVP